MNNLISDELVNDYLSVLISKLFKILPLKENNSDTLHEYLQSLQIEMFGAINVIDNVQFNRAKVLSIINIIQFFIDNDYDVVVCKREVFKCIDIIKKIEKSLG